MQAIDLNARWHTGALRHALEQAGHEAGATATVDVGVAACVDSTNTRLLEAARIDVGPVLRLLVAESQTAGRGRLGRPWHSAPGQSLMFSLSMPMSAHAGGGLSLALGAAIADVLEPLTTALPRVMLKWPNDLWLRDAAAPTGGRKLAGVLIETTGTPGGRTLVVGVGINLRPLSLPPETMPPYGMASLQEWRGWAQPPASFGDDQHPTRHAVAALLLRLAPALVRAAHAFERSGLAPWQAAWQARDALQGRRVHAGSGASACHGVVCGLRGDGALLVRGDAGQLHVLTSGEVSVRVEPFAKSGAPAAAPDG